ncbi:MAG: glutamate 5-kinase [Christensenellaceae bacterium]
MKRITIKVGSSFFINQKGNINLTKISRLAEQICALIDQGNEVLLVTSGAVAVGVKKMKLKTKPHETTKKQALAAIGQMSLMQVYEQVFDMFNIKCAQILVSHDDFGNRNRLNTLTKTVETLFSYGVVPVVNENDAVAVNEIKVGDNDTLSSMMSLAIKADLLVIVSDIDGLYTDNPNVNKEAKLIPYVEHIDDSIIALAKSPSSEFGTGGMETKIKAARICTMAGIPMLIVNQTKIDLLSTALFDKQLGTYFAPSKDKYPLKLCWIRFCANIGGTITVDDGAKSAILSRKSLLSCGITDLSRDFSPFDAVIIQDNSGKEIARGIVSFSASNVRSFIKSKSTQLVVHANNLVITEK